MVSPTVFKCGGRFFNRGVLNRRDHCNWYKTLPRDVFEISWIYMYVTMAMVIIGRTCVQHNNHEIQSSCIFTTLYATYGEEKIKRAGVGSTLCNCFYSTILMYKQWCKIHVHIIPVLYYSMCIWGSSDLTTTDYNCTRCTVVPPREIVPWSSSTTTSLYQQVQFYY